MGEWNCGKAAFLEESFGLQAVFLREIRVKLKAIWRRQ